MASWCWFSALSFCFRSKDFGIASHKPSSNARGQTIGCSVFYFTAPSIFVSAGICQVGANDGSDTCIFFVCQGVCVDCIYSTIMMSIFHSSFYQTITPSGWACLLAQRAAQRHVEIPSAHDQRRKAKRIRFGRF